MTRSTPSSRHRLDHTFAEAPSGLTPRAGPPDRGVVSRLLAPWDLSLDADEGTVRGRPHSQWRRRSPATGFVAPIASASAINPAPRRCRLPSSFHYSLDVQQHPRRLEFCHRHRGVEQRLHAAAPGRCSPHARLARAAHHFNNQVISVFARMSSASSSARRLMAFAEHARQRIGRRARPRAALRRASAGHTAPCARTMSTRSISARMPRTAGRWERDGPRQTKPDRRRRCAPEVASTSIVRRPRPYRLPAGIVAERAHGTSIGVTAGTPTSMRSASNRGRADLDHEGLSSFGAR